jgi:pilus assembly protein CpaE
MNVLQIQMQINEPELASSIRKFLDALPEVETLNSDADPMLHKIQPEIVIIDDSVRNGAVFEALSSHRQRLPDAAIYLISARKSPEHVVKAIKAGASEYFPLPLDLDHLRQSIEEVRAKSTEMGKETHSTAYSFISAKGGLGATVLAVNTAVALAGLDKTVALCDLDLRTGDSSVLLDLAPKASILDLSRNFARLDIALLKNVMARHASGVELLASPPRHSDNAAIEAGQIRGIIAHLGKIHETTMIDCPSGFPDESTAAGLGCSDRIFIILDLSVPAIRNAVQLAKELGNIGIREERIDFVVNRFVKNSVISVKEADRSLGKPLFWIFPNAYDELFSSITSGVPLVSSQPRSVFSKNVRQFGEKLGNPAAHKEFRGVSNLFGKPV